MAVCIMDKSELPEKNIYLSGFECRRSDKHLCPNYMRSMVNGKNCKLLQPAEFLYSKLSLRSTLEPIKEKYKNKPTEELKQMFIECQEKFRKNKHSDAPALLLRAQLGAIEELMAERKA